MTACTPWTFTVLIKSVLVYYWSLLLNTGSKNTTLSGCQKAHEYVSLLCDCEKLLWMPYLCWNISGSLSIINKVYWIPYSSQSTLEESTVYTGENSSLIYSYCVSKQWQLRLNMVLERAEDPPTPSIIVEEKGRGYKKTARLLAGWRAIITVKADLEKPLSGLALCPFALGCQSWRAVPRKVRRSEVMWIMRSS